MLGDPGSDLNAGKRYDRILCASGDIARFSGRAGTVDMFDGSFRPLLPGVEREMSDMQLTLQVSDHLPLWTEVGVG